MVGRIRGAFGLGCNFKQDGHEDLFQKVTLEQRQVTFWGGGSPSKQEKQIVQRP